jgi:Flp pilus assembly protein TadG
MIINDNLSRDSLKNTGETTSNTIATTAAVTNTYNTSANINDTNESPSTLAWAIGILVLGSSAGLTLYTRRSQSWLRTMKQINDNVAKKRPPPKFGPQTKKEYETMRVRIDDEDIL